MNGTVGLFLKTNQRYIAEMMLASFLINAFQLALPLFSMLLYDKAIGNEVHDTLWALTIGMLLLGVMEVLLRTGRVFLIEHAGARWDTALDERLMRGILASPVSKNLPVGDMLARYREVASTRDFLSAQFLLPLADLPFMLIFIATVIYIGGPIVCVPLGMGVFLIVLNYVLQNLSHYYQTQANATQSAKLTTLVDVLSVRESLMSKNAAAVAYASFRKPVQTGARAASRARLWSQLAQQTVPVAVSFSTVLLLVVGVFRVEAQALSIGGLISANMLSSRILTMMCSIAPVQKRWKEFTQALKALTGSVNFQAPPLGSMESSAATALRTEGIVLDNITFRYPQQDRAILDGINLHLRAGELVAVVGASGAGKSTLLRILAGHVSHQLGTLSFGSHCIDTDVKRRWLGSQVSYKPQMPSFLRGTLNEIVAPGVADPSDERVVKALRGAGLGPMLERGELGLNSVLGTNGAGLSGGQQQMVALARVLYSDCELALLDEPTLGLDRPAQEAVLLSLKALAVGRCVVVSTHATEVIQQAHRVIVLERGRIIADAPPSRLLGDAPAK